MLKDSIRPAAHPPTPTGQPAASLAPATPANGIVTTLLVAILPIGMLTTMVIGQAMAPALTVTPFSTTPGRSIIVAGATFATGQQGTLVLDGGTVLAQFKAGRSGAFATLVTVPSATTNGTHTLTAVAMSKGSAASVPASTVLASTNLAVLAPESSTLPSGSPSGSPSATPPLSPIPTPTTSGGGTGVPGSTATTSPVTPAPTAGLPPPSGLALYVATNGSNANPGTLARPLATAARAAAIAAPGTTIYLRGGTYAGFEVKRSGLTFAPYPGEAVVISEPGRSDVVDFNSVTSGVLRDMTVLGSHVVKGSAVKIDGSSGVRITGVTIRDSMTWGIVVVESNDVLLENNDISQTANAIEERYASDLVIRGNRIHANTAMVDAGRGREGINFYRSTGPVTIVGNLLWDNGTHFEVYGASNLTFIGNETWSGQVMETGTDGPACDNMRFVRNIGYRGTPYDGNASGMILRCASNTLIANNIFDGFDHFAFDITDGTLGTAYGGSIAGLRIVNNIVVGGRAFSIDSALPSSVVIDYNLVDITGATGSYGQYVAYVAGVGNFKTVAEFSAATGYMAHGVGADPRFVNRAGRDYHLLDDSPAIDSGLAIGDAFSGPAPDIGRFEAR